MAYSLMGEAEKMTGEATDDVVEIDHDNAGDIYGL